MNLYQAFSGQTGTAAFLNMVQAFAYTSKCWVTIRRLERVSGTALYTPEHINIDTSTQNEYINIDTYAKIVLEQLDHVENKQMACLDETYTALLTSKTGVRCKIGIRDYKAYVIHERISSSDKYNEFIFNMFGIICMKWFGFTTDTPAAMLLKSYIEDCNLEYADRYLDVAKQEIIAQRTTKLRQQLVEATTKNPDKEVRELHAQITSRQQRITDNYDVIDVLRKEIEELNYKILALKTIPQETDNEFIDYLMSLNNCRILYTSGHCVELELHTPITNYRYEDVEMYYKHPEKSNIVTEEKWVADFIKEVFMEQKYSMYFKTQVTFPLDYNSIRDMYWSNTTYGNPHLSHYQCFESTKSAIRQALNDNNRIDALNATIACAATLVFTDHAVITRFINMIKNQSDYDNGEQTLVSNTTGEAITIKEWKENYFNALHKNDSGDN